ncbi:putative transmembrane protein [Toxoplasma gondii TgCatPRC2]|uniref:Transmembrane protein n=15 Tax=Toxoplasma gondii TaxID=5811 RepID=A0A125YXP9_TOXGV|nr:hypothetical protein TGME49_304890 [Toxoplasma gondii ME49]EPR57468.1 hypothetical protein TGGT1_304890 [Toxoplasma gondii GT1]ESS29014.1 putative transmembrane protein [Toxoplasma gondii VEG]KAF4644675.1 hypothetical protein TGRH88_016690 [Toxoplasma gondii]KFG28418.1 putative transmembrane protein [Toxoplasma gondii p89]KFG33202.1 putative transmembrane protein [Toxoplasma gondii GAB2-2007-GAL-DOM2]KFG45587.1 putative transmembrane protein [Toxoplasma gondii FOU]KFG59210.1 putative tran|eukprot:XP_018636118.1 hypothetical protein TGME49_304890 [Toxoplasma gondii ME49]
MAAVAAAVGGGGPPPARVNTQAAGGGRNQQGGGGKGQSPADTTMVYLICCKNFCTDILRVTIVSYFFWVALLYLVGAIVLVTGFQYTVPRVNTEIACPMKPSVYLFSGAWFLQSLILFFTCWGYSTISASSPTATVSAPAPIDDSQAEGLRFERLTTGLSVLGVFVKTVPTWIRLVHVFNMCQTIVWIIDLLLLPECNEAGLRWIVAIILVFWWVVVAVGVLAKRRIFVPPALYDPLRPGQGALRSLRHLLRGFGP